MDIKTEGGISSREEETSSHHDWAATVKLENAAPAEDETRGTGNSGFFETETQPKGIKTERVEVESAGNLSLDDRILPYASPAAGGNILIKKEEDIDTDDDVFQAIIESNYRPPESEERSQCESYGQASDTVMKLCEEDSVSRSAVPQDNLSELQRPKAYYYSHGFKLAHVSVVLIDLKSHPITNTSKKQCTYCLGKFTNLKQHMTTHTGEKRFSCACCPAKFSQKITLKRHMRTHTNEKPFLCTYCPAKFSRNHGLKIHLRIHTSEKPFLCTYCPAKFYQKINLKTHLRIHTNEKPFLCSYCPDKFSRSTLLKLHIRTHSHK